MAFEHARCLPTGSMLARQPQPVFIHSWSILLNDLMVVVVILAPVEVVVESKEARDSTVTLESLLGSYWSQEGEQTSSQHQNSFASTSLHEVCGITYLVVVVVVVVFGGFHPELSFMRQQVSAKTNYTLFTDCISNYLLTMAIKLSLTN